MRVTSKGQVTIPQKMREHLGLLPETEVEFEMIKGGILIKKRRGTNSFGKKLIDRMRGRSDSKLTTDEILDLTRG